MNYYNQINRPKRAPPRPKRNPLREQHKLHRLWLYNPHNKHDTKYSPTPFPAHTTTYASTMLPPCNVMILGSNESCCCSSALRLNTPHMHMGPEPALPGVFHLDQDTISGAGQCPQHNHLAAPAHFLCLASEASLNSTITMRPSNLDAHAYTHPFSDTDGSQSSIALVTGEESSRFMSATPCIAQGPVAVPATTCDSSTRTIRKRPASPDLRADYLRLAILSPHSSSGGNANTNLPMKSTLKAGLGLGITLDSEGGSSDALFDDSATITPTAIAISAHMMDRFNNDSDRTVVPATPGKRAATSRTFFSVSSSPMSPPVIVVSHTESQAMQDTVISPKVATKTKTKVKSKSKTRSTKTKGKKQSNEATESKSVQGYAAVASPPPLAPQLGMTRSGYSRHH